VICGNEISMIFQEPMTSLNPVFTIGNQIMEAILFHQKVSKEEARRKTIEMLDRVRIPTPEKTIDAYPHQLSGGMRQRAMIAMAFLPTQTPDCRRTYDRARCDGPARDS
jgi:ABC-type dipeptide/oligopeptide/nickel transport system ATPase component